MGSTPGGQPILYSGKQGVPSGGLGHTSGARTISPAPIDTVVVAGLHASQTAHKPAASSMFQAVQLPPSPSQCPTGFTLVQPPPGNRAIQGCCTQVVLLQVESPCCVRTLAAPPLMILV